MPANERQNMLTSELNILMIELNILLTQINIIITDYICLSHVCKRETKHIRYSQKWFIFKLQMKSKYLWVFFS